MTYHATIVEDWNKTTTDKDAYASDPTQQEEGDAFFLLRPFPRS